MTMNPLGMQSFTREERELLTQFRKLDAAGKRSAADFLEWLAQRADKDANLSEAAPQPLPEPQAIPRPNEESVVRAIKRLTATYHMIDATTLFEQTSSLMTQHILQGRASIEVIDELETLFRERYQQLKDGQP